MFKYTASAAIPRLLLLPAVAGENFGLLASISSGWRAWEVVTADALRES